MSKDEVIQTAKAAAEVVLEFVKWYEKREQGLAYVKGEEPAAPRVVQRQEGKPETPAQELKQTEKPAKQTPQLQEGDYFLKKGVITDGVASVMRSFGWNRSFDTQGLNSFLRYHNIPNSFISDLYEKDIKAGTLTSANVQTLMSQKLRGKKGFTKLEMDFIEQILPRAVKKYQSRKRLNNNLRKEPLLKKGEISSEMAELMKEHGWTGSFDCAGLKGVIVQKGLSKMEIGRRLFEDDEAVKEVSLKSSLNSRLSARTAFSVREIDRFVQILRELLPPVDIKPSSSGTPFLVWGKADDGSIRDGQNNVIAKDEDDFTPEKAESLEKAALGETCETGENGEPVNTEEPSNTKLQPDLKQGPGRGNWIRNAFKSLTAGL